MWQYTKKILTLTLEFPNNYSKECVLRRNVTSSHRHVWSLRRIYPQIAGEPSQVNPEVTDAGPSRCFPRH